MACVVFIVEYVYAQSWNRSCTRRAKNVRKYRSWNAKMKLHSLHARILLIALYGVLFSYEIYLIIGSNVKGEDILLLSCSLFLFLISFASLFFSRKVYHLLYKFGEKMLKRTGEVPVYESDGYKKYPLICSWLLIIANVLIVIGIIFRLLI